MQTQGRGHDGKVRVGREHEGKGVRARARGQGCDGKARVEREGKGKGTM